jgi:predicted DNA-binding protein YlxM (UPF0122 family)
VFNDIDPALDRRNKIDLSEAIKLYFDHGLPMTVIAERYGCTKQAVHQALAPYKDIILDNRTMDAWQSNRIRIKDSIEHHLLLDLADPVKRAGASLNNVAYAYRQIHETRRLDEGLSTSNVDLHAEFESLKQLRDAKSILQNAVLSTTQNDYHE